MPPVSAIPGCRATILRVSYVPCKLALSAWNNIEDLDDWLDSLTRFERFGLTIFLVESVLLLANLLQLFLNWLARLINQ